MPDDVRQRIAAEAMTWLGTPFLDGACVKGAGVDCARFVAAVYEACGVIPAQEIAPYAAQWFLHKEDEKFIGYVEKLAREIDPAQARAGDLVLYRFGRAFAHGAIVLAWPTEVIHAHGGSRAVVTSGGFEGDLAGRPVRAFDLVDRG